MAPAADPAAKRATVGRSFDVSLCSHFFICQQHKVTTVADVK